MPSKNIVHNSKCMQKKLENYRIFKHVEALPKIGYVYLNDNIDFHVDSKANYFSKLGTHSF